MKTKYTDFLLLEEEIKNSDSEIETQNDQSETVSKKFDSTAFNDDYSKITNILNDFWTNLATKSELKPEIKEGEIYSKEELRAQVKQELQTVTALKGKIVILEKDFKSKTVQEKKVAQKEIDSLKKQLAEETASLKRNKIKLDKLEPFKPDEVKKTGVTTVPTAPTKPIKNKEYNYKTNNKETEVVKIFNPQPSRKSTIAEVEVISSKDNKTKAGTHHQANWTKLTPKDEVKKTGVPVAPVAPIEGKEYSYFTNNKDNQIVRVENPQSKEPNRAEVKVISSERGTTKPGTLYTVDWSKLKPKK